MKKTIVALLFALIAAPVVAQPRPMPPPGPGGRPPGDAALVNYLQLTTDQKTAWDAAHKDFGAVVQPLFDKQRAAHQQLDAALQNKSTDPCSLGTQMLAIHAIGDQIKAAHAALDQKLDSILTADQRSKYEAFEAAMAAQHGPGGPGGPGGPRP
jgi:Spy/CpxP family protein refolding chaperone